MHNRKRVRLFIFEFYFLITNETQLEALKGKESAVLFSWVSAAPTAAAKPPGMGLWRPRKTTRQTLGSIS
jgi:hypothetical protein